MTCNINKSLSQPAFEAKQLLENEAIVAQKQQIAMYDLMEKAGTAVFKVLEKKPLHKKLLVICGKGNNGGDGFVIARLAQQAGWHVTVGLLTAEKNLKGDALRAYQYLLATITPLQVHTLTVNSDYKTLLKNNFSHIVDAIFGIGFKGQLPNHINNLIEQLNKHNAYKIAVDIPSGVNATTGYVSQTAFRADKTITFIAQKQGLHTSQAPNYTGKIKLAGITLNHMFTKQIHSNVSLQHKNNLPLLPKRKSTQHKGNIGQLLTIGGNQNFPGAIRLASHAALKTGASLVTVCSHKSSQLLVHNQLPELMIAGDNLASLKQNSFLEKTKQILIGPGLGQNNWAKSLFEHALSTDKPMVVDADALNLLSHSPIYRENWVLTPHPGEAARLLNCTIDEIEKNRFAAVKKIAKNYGGICVLKGAGSLIANREYCWINTSGNPAMASGGMGDVLSGIIAALLMQINDKLAAVRLAVFIHGAIADSIVKKQGEVGLLASDIIDAIPHKLSQLNQRKYQQYT